MAIYWGQSSTQGVTAGDLDAFETLAAKRMSVLMVATAWWASGAYPSFVYQPFPTDKANLAHSRGAIFDWEWVQGTWSTPITEMNLRSVYQLHYHDTYIDACADAVKALNYPIMIRLNPEMNGNWLPCYSEQVTPLNLGLGSGDFIAGWRYIVDRFRARGATNVAWTWCVNNMSVTAGQSTYAALSNFYPGDSYVDWKSIDCYNFGNPWQTLGEVLHGGGATGLQDTLANVIAVGDSTKPIHVEFGCPDIDESGVANGPRKAAWFTDAFGTFLPANPSIKSIIYSNYVDGSWNYLINSQPGVTDSAFAGGVGSSYYLAGGAFALPTGMVAVPAPTVATAGRDVTLSWTTDIPGSTQVEYGTTTSYGTLSPYVATRSTSHSVVLAALPSGTTYHWRARSRNAAGTETVSVDQTFTTPGVPVIANLAAVVTTTGATVTWSTDRTAASQVEYGQTTAYGTSISDPALVTSHTLTISGLSPGTTYHFRAHAVASDQQEGISSDATLVTSTQSTGGGGDSGGGGGGGGGGAGASNTGSPGPTFIWIEPVSGIAHQLTGQPDLEVIQGRQNLHMPTVRLSEDRIPGAGWAGGGARLRDHVYESREVDLPLFLHCADYATLWARHDEISSWFRVRRDASGTPVPGILQCTSPSGNVRQLFAVYAGGLHGVEGSGVSGPTFRRMILQLRASDPMWYAANPSAVTFAMVAGAPFFGSPFLPLKLALSVVSAGAPVVNPGDEVCWPIWKIIGPGTNPVVTNVSTGQSLSLTLALSGGQSVTIDTRPSKKSIVDGAGASLYSALTPGNATMWPLQPGSNTVQVTMGGATSGSQLVLTFTPSYLGP